MTLFRPIALAFAATLAVGGAHAYEKAETKRQVEILVSEAEVDPGIDLMITGPSGPSKQVINLPKTEPPQRAERRRMVVHR